jgi:hypothetical protein
MTINTITIEKAKYRALLERVFQLEFAEHGEPLPHAIGNIIENMGRNMRYSDFTVAQMRSVFTDISLLSDYVELVVEDEQDVQEEIIREIGKVDLRKNHDDDTFGH